MILCLCSNEIGDASRAESHRIIWIRWFSCKNWIANIEWRNWYKRFSWFWFILVKYTKIPLYQLSLAYLYIAAPSPCFSFVGGRVRLHIGYLPFIWDGGRLVVKTSTFSCVWGAAYLIAFTSNVLCVWSQNYNFCAWLSTSSGFVKASWYRYVLFYFFSILFK